MSKINLLIIINGTYFSPLFLSSWTKLIQYFTMNNIRFAFCINDINSAISLNKILGGHSYNNNQMILDNKVKPDKILILNSKLFFKPCDIKSLLDSPRDIITGFCLGHEHVLASESMNESYFNKNEMYKPIKIDELKDIVNTGEYELAYTVLDFICIKSEVFNSLKYPWFKNKPTKNGKGFYDHEISFCKDVTELGYTIWGDTGVVIGREKIAQIYDTDIFEKIMQRRKEIEENESERLETID